jgi:hypothetical protein
MLSPLQLYCFHRPGGTPSKSRGRECPRHRNNGCENLGHQATSCCPSSRHFLRLRDGLTPAGPGTNDGESMMARKSSSGSKVFERVGELASEHGAITNSEFLAITHATSSTLSVPRVHHEALRGALDPRIISQLGATGMADGLLKIQQRIPPCDIDFWARAVCEFRKLRSAQ